MCGTVFHCTESLRMIVPFAVVTLIIYIPEAKAEVSNFALVPQLRRVSSIRPLMSQRVSSWMGCSQETVV